MLKRSFDIVAAVIGLVILLPLWLVIAVAIKMDSEGPVLFRQHRVGRKGKPFLIWKFRSMQDRTVGAAITIGSDARVSRVGAVLRQFKLDEIPQLVNVVRGDMSFVGPRPELPEYVAMYAPADAQVILSIRPGLTGESSLRFRRESELLATYENPLDAYVNVILPQKIELDKEYARNHSLVGDLRLLLRTIALIAVRG